MRVKILLGKTAKEMEDLTNEFLEMNEGRIIIHNIQYLFNAQVFILYSLKRMKPTYSSSFKKKIALEVISGNLKKSEASLKYSIGLSTVGRWCKKYKGRK